MSNKKFNLSPEELRQMYLKQKLSARKIAKRAEIDYTRVLHYLHKFNIPVRKRSPFEGIFRPTEEELRELYIVRKMSLAKIGEMYGVSRKTVAYWIRKKGLKVRTKSEAKKGELNSFYGRKHSERTKELISNKKRGKRAWNRGLSKETDERIKRLAEKLKGQVFSIERRRKIAQSRIGKCCGEKNPNWRGGYEPYYGSNWLQQRRKALERDRHTCQICGASEQGKEHDVHHIIPFREFGLSNYLEANRLSNLITLCHLCHLQVENGGENF